MTLDQVLAMWAEDSVIDENNLDLTTIKLATLHSKYLELLSVSKLTLRRRVTELAELKKTKWLYFEGRMSKEEMDEKGWDYDPFNGSTKPLKGNMELYYKADPDLVAMESRLEYQEAITNALIDIMEAIKWRHQSIRNIIDWKKFTSGA